MAYQVISKSNNTFWLMTSNGNWISSHHSTDEAIAACRVWFKCSPIVRLKQEGPIAQQSMLKQRLANILIKVAEIISDIIKKTLDKNNKRELHEFRH
ncbi:hypothetical protein [Litoribrevibacter albus]|uniref:Uncharacterized protein n=1 Tax=Litoribrevibacter albus TaxID=1473156 RepID=A0AA37S7W4_9GAMM|nr:hypothetical protein [Litoribrevibacter albus]GLQ29794.1 hypothetical protein GCM10007876_02720 [Litoribrevibacter albus]